ncbi:SE1561 family protein [Sporosarcina sp. Te-1]|uniref:SE1561 family protein n=1 Tax=Sporosarcina sp. Te-1 TaxID=2818390 RepID=UPI001A9D1E3B|nr:SE1561 family protein [Sporosarcina sp. Te-1]QTD42895.1 hypothetical protein J3U78_09205 [Sporosarcina sp. Te-1]
MNQPQNNGQVEQLKNRLHLFLEKLESIEPETADLQEIDQLILLVDEIEQQMEQIKTDN